MINLVNAANTRSRLRDRAGSAGVRLIDFVGDRAIECMLYLMVLGVLIMTLGLYFAAPSENAASFSDRCRKDGGTVNTISGERENTERFLFSQTLRFCALPGGRPVTR